jgi:hypothetical protein
MTETTSFFSVHFGKIARTLVYQDALGTLTFVFEISPTGDSEPVKFNLILSKHALDQEGKLYACHTEADRQRNAVALRRVAQYVESCGYVVSRENNGLGAS